MENFLDYEILPCANVSEGLPRQRLAVLSPIWQGEILLLEYPDGAIHVLRGWSAALNPELLVTSKSSGPATSSRAPRSAWLSAATTVSGTWALGRRTPQPKVTPSWPWPRA